MKIIYLRFGYLRLISYICVNFKRHYMNSFSLLKDFIIIDDEKYYHYEIGGKWTSTKFVVINGIHYYNSNRPVVFAY